MLHPLPHLNLTTIIRKEIQRVEILRISSPIDANIIPERGELNALIVDFGTRAAIVAGAFGVGVVVGGEPAVMALALLEGAVVCEIGGHGIVREGEGESESASAHSEGEGEESCGFHDFVIVEFVI